MAIIKEELSRWTRLELAMFADRPVSVGELELRRLEMLKSMPVEVISSNCNGYDLELQAIVSQLSGQHRDFMSLRTRVAMELAKLGNGFAIAVMYDGIYVGHPRDVYYHFSHEKPEIPVHRLKGFGKKVADIEFIDTNYAP